MAGLFVEEYSNLHFQEGTVFPIPGKLIAVQEITIGTAAELGSALNEKTKFVCLSAEGACHFRFGTHGAITATTSDRWLPAGASRFFEIDQGTETGVGAITP